jgi:flagella basal body P-ring formation protein FlgA
MMRGLAILACLNAFPAAAETVVALRNLRVHTLISAADIAVEAGTITGAATSAEDVIGLETRVAIYKGRPILPQELGSPTIVERNQIVPLTVSLGALAISAEGRALDRGGVGDFVRVMNTTSRTTVSGVIRVDGSVSVLSAH